MTPGQTNVKRKATDESNPLAALAAKKAKKDVSCPPQYCLVYASVAIMSCACIAVVSEHPTNIHLGTPRPKLMLRLKSGNVCLLCL